MQEDMKKLIAYSSVAHMGFVTLGIFTFTKQGIDGGMFQMISHGLISAAALFLSVGVLYDRTHSRLISSYGGVVNSIPKYSLVFMIFVLAALGLPGTTGFLGRIFNFSWSFSKKLFSCFISYHWSCACSCLYALVI